MSAMKRLVQRTTSVYRRLEAADWLPRLVARLGMGLMFAGGALKKLQTLEDFTKYFESLGIPAARVQAPTVAVLELVAGVLLMIGLLTRPAAVILTGIMVVATVTAQIPEHHITASWKGLLDLLYVPDVLLIFLLVWLVFAGPGKASVDARLARR